MCLFFYSLRIISHKHIIVGLLRDFVVYFCITFKYVLHCVFAESIIIEVMLFVYLQKTTYYNDFNNC